MTQKIEGFTPGPWEAVTGRWDDAAEVVDANGYEVVDISYVSINRRWLDEHPDEHWGSGGDASHIERDLNEIEANAALIAQAPTLYAENERLRDTVAYVADRMEKMEAPVLHGGAAMVPKADLAWLARKLRAALSEGGAAKPYSDADAGSSYAFDDRHTGGD